MSKSSGADSGSMINNYEWYNKQETDKEKSIKEAQERIEKLRLELAPVQTTKLVGWEKLKYKMIENPFVPIGVIATATAVALGLRAMVRGDRRMSNLMMRARVGCQAFAIAAIIVGFEMTRRRELAAAGESKKVDQ